MAQRDGGLRWRWLEAGIVIAALAAAIAFVPGCGTSRSRSSHAKRERTEPASPPKQSPQHGQSKAEGSAPQPQAVANSKNSDSAAATKTAHGDTPIALSGKQLFAEHCAACHGDNGNGNGMAARFLFPKPRDFRLGRFRLVSTGNHVPSREDLDAVLRRGMPGSAMPPWSHLAKAQRELLIDEIMRLRTDGARELYVRTLKEQEELTDDEIAADDVQAEIQDYVKRFTTPGPTTDVPEIGQPTDDAMARGKDAYTKNGCVQ